MDIKIGIIIPDRGDRPEFLENCKRLIKDQTLQPEIVELVDYKPTSNQVDITPRYRTGYNNLRKKGLDLIALIENDEWYSADYLEIMAKAWLKHGKPEIIGPNYTIYYHLKLQKYFKFNHVRRASAMNTLLKPDIDFTWPVDSDPFTDTHLWKNLKGTTFEPEKIVCIGMKHGKGKCGGRFHIDKLHRFEIPDNGFLKNTVDEISYKFYQQFYDKSFTS